MRATLATGLFLFLSLGSFGVFAQSDREGTDQEATDKGAAIEFGSRAVGVPPLRRETGGERASGRAAIEFGSRAVGVPPLRRETDGERASGRVAIEFGSRAVGVPPLRLGSVRATNDDRVAIGIRSRAVGVAPLRRETNRTVEVVRRDGPNVIRVEDDRPLLSRRDRRNASRQRRIVALRAPAVRQGRARERDEGSDRAREVGIGSASRDSRSTSLGVGVAGSVSRAIGRQPVTIIQPAILGGVPANTMLLSNGGVVANPNLFPFQQQQGVFLRAGGGSGTFDPVRGGVVVGPRGTVRLDGNTRQSFVLNQPVTVFPAAVGPVVSVPIITGPIIGPRPAAAPNVRVRASGVQPRFRSTR